jgi:hypothetical protein
MHPKLPAHLLSSLRKNQSSDDHEFDGLVELEISLEEEKQALTSNSDDAGEKKIIDRTRQIRIAYPNHGAVTPGRALKLHFGAKSRRKETSRIYRVTGARKAGTASTTHPESQSNVEGPIIEAHSGQFLCVCVRDKRHGCVSLVIGQPTLFDTANGKGQRCVAISDLHCETTTVHIQILHAFEDGDAFLFPAVSLENKARRSSVPGYSTNLVNPEYIQSKDDTRSLVCKLSISDCNALLDVEASRLDSKKFRILTSSYAYTDSANNVILVRVGSESGDPEGNSITERAGDQKSKCPLCKIFISNDVNARRQHIGAHILTQSSWEIYCVPRPKFPCGLCGIHESVGGATLAVLPGLRREAPANPKFHATNASNLEAT